MKIQGTVQESWGFLDGSVIKNLPANAGVSGDEGFDSWVRKIPWRRKEQPTPAFLSWKSHGEACQGYIPWGLKRVREDLVTKQQQHPCTHH